MGEAKVILTAEDKASSIIQGVTKQLGIFNQQGLAMGVTFAATNAAINLAMNQVQRLTQYVTDSITAYRQYERQLLQVKNVLGGLPMEQTSRMVDQFSLAWGQSSESIMEAMIQIKQSGIALKDLNSILTQSSILAVRTFSDEATAAQSLSDTMQAFSAGSSQAAYIQGLLTEQQQATGMGLGELSTDIQRIAPTAQSVGMSISDLTSAVGRLNQAGLPSRSIFQNLNSILTTLSNPTQDQINLMGQYGVAVDSLTLRAEGLTGVLRRLSTTMSATALQSLFGTSYTAAMDLTKTKGTSVFGADAVRQINEYYQSPAGVAEKQKAIQSTAQKNVGKGIWDWIGSGLDAIGTFITEAGDYQLHKKGLLQGTPVAIENMMANAQQQQAVNLLPVQTTIGGLQAQQQTITGLIQTWKDLTAQSKLYGEELTQLRSQQAFTLGIKDLTEQLWREQDAMAALGQQMNQYQLAEMQIQYSAMGPRGEHLTHAQQMQLYQLQKQELANRIQQQQTGMGMSTTQLAIEQQTRVFAMQSALDNLDLSIREKQYLLSSYQADIAATLKNITDDMVGQVSAIREAQKTYTSSAEVAEFKKTFGEDYPAAINKAIARLRIWELMTGQTNLASFAGMVFGVLGSRAGGGYIPETGPYLLHEGETVVPSNTSYGGDTYITMHVNVSQKLTSSELRSLLASASNDRVIGRGAKTRTRTR